MEKRVREFIARHHLLDSGGLHLVALSGGADSVCLLLMLLRLGYRVEAMHCNFHLRGEESDRDETFVKTLCQHVETGLVPARCPDVGSAPVPARNGVPLHLAHFDTRAYASLHHVSIEMAARELRYAWFEQLRRDLGAETICVAHHSDDNVETVLMNLLRGTGLRGLQGIQPRRGHIVRPLLCVSREEIEQWLHKQGQDFVTDSTNAKADVVRNKLRLDIIPRLKDVFPQATSNILSTAHHASEALKVYDHAVGERLRCLVGNASKRLQQGLENSISIDELLQEPSPESILFEWLSPKGFSSQTILQITQTLCSRGATVPAGREWSSSTHTLVSHSGRLLLTTIEEQRNPLRIPEPGTYVYDDQTKLRIAIREGRHIERNNPNVCCADASTIAFPLELRHIRQGDRFRPLGMKGTRLVSDFLTDQHLSVVEKRRQLVLCDANDSIVWLIGRRLDDRYKVTEKTTKTQILEFLSPPI